MRQLKRLASGLVTLNVCAFASLLAADPQPAHVQKSPTASRRPKDATAERDRLWDAASEFGRKENWPEAIRAARAAFTLQTRYFGDQPEFACQLLDALTFWSTQRQDFSGALATARELTRRRTKLSGPDHAQTIDARLNITLIERLAELTPDEWQQFKSADKLHGEAAILQRSGQLELALARFEQALPIYTKLLGADQPVRLTCLMNITMCQVELGQYLKAYPNVKELVERMPSVKGALHPDTIVTLTVLGRFNEATSSLQNAEDAYRKVVEIQTALLGTDHPDTWKVWVEVGKVCSDRDKFDEGKAILEKALQQQRLTLGNDHQTTALTMKILGTAYGRAKKVADAEPLLTESINVLRRQAGERHLWTASAYNARGRLYVDMGRQADAEQDLDLSLAICRELLPPEHPIIGKVLDNLARLEEWRGNTILVRQFRLKCMHIAETAFGQMSLPTAEAAENLARAYIVMNDFGLAEPYLLQARKIRQDILGESHPQTAMIEGHLAYVYLCVNEPQRSEPLYHQALAVLDQTDDSTTTVRLRKQLALLYQSLGNFDEAEKQYRQVLRVLEQQSPRNAVRVAEVQVGLAQTVLTKGNVSEACQLIDDVVDVYDKTLSKDHPQWLDALGVAGLAHLAAGNHKIAERHLARGLQIAEGYMDWQGPFESERQRLAQMKLMRNDLDLYLSLPQLKEAGGSAVYQYVVTWKGAIAMRQWRDRRIATAETGPLTEELRQISRRLGTLTLHPPDVTNREPWMREIFTLNMRKEALEQQRAYVTGQLKRQPMAEVQRADLQNMVPAGTALVDFLQYTHTSFETEKGRQQMKSRQRHVAFIVRRNQPVQCVELGDAAPIEEAVGKLQKTRGFAPKSGGSDWGGTLSRLLWEPIRPHLDGCQVVLISPDGNLSQLAWNALPGRDPGTYLIEDFGIGIVPVPQMLCASLKANAGMESIDAITRESLLLIGDINYSTASHEASSSQESSAHIVQMDFKPLKGTAAEVQALRDQFEQQFPEGSCLLLDKDRATEAAFWREAPRHRWLHVATHGFFAPAEIKSAIATQKRMEPTTSNEQGVSIFHVGFLNGLAMSGANHGPTDNGDDGVLTAAEIAMMDLQDVDVVVLSGCETALGQVERGEGAFGMERALQIAGVNTTVGSLWTVSDEKTNLLMQRFYANLWGKKLTKLDALREAQLWMLNGGDRAGKSQPPGAGKRISPHYWAAFTLSGKWR